jgi:hypothetical protein
LQTLVPQLQFLQVVAVFCLVAAYELGPGPISWFIAAELFDQQARPIAMAFTSMLNWGGKFLLALIYPPLLVSNAFPFIFLALFFHLSFLLSFTIITPLCWWYTLYFILNVFPLFICL